MKIRLLSIIIVVSSIMMLAVSVSAGTNKIEGKKTAIAYQAPIIVDGVVDEAWANAPEVSFDTMQSLSSS